MKNNIFFKIIKLNKYTLKNTLILSIIIGFLAQITVNIYKDDNFSIGISLICMAVLYTLCENFYPIITGLLSSVIVIFIRFYIFKFSYITYDSFIENMYLLTPSMIVYFLYGVLNKILPLKYNNSDTMHLMIKIMFFDFICNFSELLLRNLVSIKNIRLIVLTALIRGFISYVVILLYKYNKLYIEQSSHKDRYIKLNMLSSKIYAESFYLQKSSKDLDYLMKESFELYSSSKQNPAFQKFASKCLTIAQNAHEIRKNNDRVLSGIKDLLEDNEKECGLFLSEIIDMIRDNTKRQLKFENSKLNINFSIHGDKFVVDYYDFFAILNNLIINSIESCGEEGNIFVEAVTDKNSIKLCVKDDGPGIEKDTLQYIFNAGFSTKFDTKTGKISTGIGLCHVKNLIQNLDGSINVTSNPYVNTEFTIILPIKL